MTSRRSSGSSSIAGRRAGPSDVARLTEALTRSATAEDEPNATPQLGGAELKQRMDALGVAVRAGVDPEAAARVVGLPGVEFTGAVPVSLRLPEAEATRLEEG